jgi:hypothetical protein
MKAPQPEPDLRAWQELWRRLLEPPRLASVEPKGKGREDESRPAK